LSALSPSQSKISNGGFLSILLFTINHFLTDLDTFIHPTPLLTSAERLIVSLAPTSQGGPSTFTPSRTFVHITGKLYSAIKFGELEPTIDESQAFLGTPSQVHGTLFFNETGGLTQESCVTVTVAGTGTGRKTRPHYLKPTEDSHISHTLVGSPEVCGTVEFLGDGEHRGDYVQPNILRYVPVDSAVILTTNGTQNGPAS
jgi:hypothetical protein